MKNCSKSMKKAIYIIILLLPNLLFSQIDLEDYEFDRNEKIVIRLVNGDVLTGYIISEFNEDDRGEGIKFKMNLGTAKIFASEIAEINPFSRQYRHDHRHFLLPSAKPIGKDHFISNFEVLFFYGGFGISDIVSVTAGRSVIPTVRASKQISELNVKATVYKTDWKSGEGGMYIALGGNMIFINSDNRLLHNYLTVSLSGAKSLLTASVYYKYGGDDYYRAIFRDVAYDFIYEDGAFGLALGVDTKFTSYHGLHFIGEVWNSNIAKPSNTGIMLGFRVANARVAGDFGIALFTEPFVVPFLGFTWTPFR